MDLTETAQSFLRNWFPAYMLSTDAEAVGPFRKDLLATSSFGLARCYAAVRDAALHRVISLIDRPTW
ncbi:hypothetical protein BST24_21660 [Mycobacteroides franklinii]|nr:hypothetical protein BST24_21660 [Mycobacteroides franklinii]